jgi:hypothetical protein
MGAENRRLNRTKPRGGEAAGTVPRRRRGQRAACHSVCMRPLSVDGARGRGKRGGEGLQGTCLRTRPLLEVLPRLIAARRTQRNEVSECLKRVASLERDA